VGLFDVFKRPAPRPSEHSGRIAARVLDQLVLLHPEEPERLEVRARIRHGQMLIESMMVPAVGPLQTPEGLADDHGLRTALLAEALGYLWASLGQSLDRDATVEFSTTPRSINVAGVELKADPSLRLHGSDFLTWLRAAGRLSPDRQQQLQHALTEHGTLAWQRQQGELHFPDGASFKVHVLGSYAPSQYSWCWAWANPGLAEAEQAGIQRVRTAAALPLFAAPGFPCTEPFAFVVAQAARDQIAPELGVWRWPQRSGAQLFFAVDMRQLEESSRRAS
jgi:hypothetical protein